MKIKKGHITGFISTVLIFCAVFLYIYNGTMEKVWIYSLQGQSKTYIGKNIYNGSFSEKEDYFAYTKYNGTLKLQKTDSPKEVIFSEKNINQFFFVKDMLVCVDKEGALFSYDFIKKEKTNYDIDCFNKYVCMMKNNIYAITHNGITEFDITGTQKTKEFKNKLNYKIPEDIFVGKDYFCVFSENSADFYSYPMFEKESVKIRDYKEKGTAVKNITGDYLIVYVNKDGKTVIKNDVTNIKDDIISPHSVLVSDNKILVAERKNIFCYDQSGKKLWNKEMHSNTLVPSNGKYFISLYPKTHACAYEAETGKEKYVFDNLQKAVFSPLDNYVFATEKSIY